MDLYIERKKNRKKEEVNGISLVPLGGKTMIFFPS